MPFIASLVGLKIVTSIAKEMLNWELAKRVIPNLYYAGEVIVQNAANQVANSRLRRQQQSTSSDAAQTAAFPTSLFYSSSSSTLSPRIISSSSTEYLVHNKLEALFAWFQVVVLWHDPYNSLIAISGILTSLLLLIHFAPSFYATIMIALFVYNLTKLWFRHIWPEIRVPLTADKEAEAKLDVNHFTYLHPDLLTLNEFGQITSNLIKTSERLLSRLLALRREKPIKFCLIITSLLSCTAYIGNRLTDASLLFSITSALLIAPGIYLYVLPKHIKGYIRKLLHGQADRDIIDGDASDSGDLSACHVAQNETIYESLIKDDEVDQDVDVASHIVTSTSSKEIESNPIVNSSSWSSSSTSSSIEKVQLSGTKSEVNSSGDERNEDEVKLDRQHSESEGVVVTGADGEDDDGFVIL